MIAECCQHPSDTGDQNPGGPGQAATYFGRCVATRFSIERKASVSLTPPSRRKSIGEMVNILDPIRM